MSEALLDRCGGGLGLGGGGGGGLGGGLGLVDFRKEAGSRCERVLVQVCVCMCARGSSRGLGGGLGLVDVRKEAGSRCERVCKCVRVCTGQQPRAGRKAGAGWFLGRRSGAGAAGLNHP